MSFSSSTRGIFFGWVGGNNSKHVTLRQLQLNFCWWLGSPHHVAGAFFYTPPKFNIAPENRPSQKETHLPTIHFQGLCLTSRGYMLSFLGRSNIIQPYPSRGMTAPQRLFDFILVMEEVWQTIFEIGESYTCSIYISKRWYYYITTLYKLYIYIYSTRSTRYRILFVNRRSNKKQT